MMAFERSEMIGYKANGHMWGGRPEGQLKKTMKMKKMKLVLTLRYIV